MTKIPFLSFDKMNADVKASMYEAFAQVFESKWYIMGERLAEFEKLFAAFIGVEHSIGVANGLDALYISLKVLGIGEGDEVLVPSNTYIASWLAVSYTGAVPVPVEPRMETYNIDPSRIEEKITFRTKAIMPVHLYGQACEMDKIMHLAGKHGLYMVEDNAQAQGAFFKGMMTGSFGHCNGTSFYPGKNLGAYGDAGAVTTNDNSINEKVRTFRNYGSQVKYFNDIKGTNSRLDEMQAAFLSAKLRYLAAWNAERVKIAEKYNERLKGIDDVVLPVVAEGAGSVYHLYVIRTAKRNALQELLAKKDVQTMIHYPVPPHLQKAYSEMNMGKGSLPLAEEIANTCLSLPIYPGLGEVSIDRICDNINSFYQ